MGFNVLAWTFHPEKHEDFVKDHHIHMVKSVSELCGAADVVTLHIRGSRDADGLMGIRELEAMKTRRGYLINTARASIVDYKAIKTALRYK